ncbi:hypothetical protein BH10BAC5_BH10BAC5_12450 [soil metagenome]
MNYSNAEVISENFDFENPFSNEFEEKPEHEDNSEKNSSFNHYLPDFESPFSATNEDREENESIENKELAQNYVSTLGTLNDSEFSEVLYELATEIQNLLPSETSSQYFNGEAAENFALDLGRKHLSQLISDSESMIDKASEYFSGRGTDEISEAEIDHYFSSLEINNENYTPAQDQFIKKLIKKSGGIVKSAFKLKGILNKLSPVHILLEKVKPFIAPLLGKVLKLAIGKLPSNVQPFAQTLAAKLLKKDVPVTTSPDESEFENESSYRSASTDIATESNIDHLANEFDISIANLIYSEDEMDADQIVKEYEGSEYANAEYIVSEDGFPVNVSSIPNLYQARIKFVNELKDLKEGESPAPVFENFLPALIPIIKMGIKLIGRPKVIGFIANLLAKLVSKYIPQDAAISLSNAIVDKGLKMIGFESYEQGKPDLAYEAIANTVEETFRNISSLDESVLNNEDKLTAFTVNEFEKAVANNFPSNVLKTTLRSNNLNGTFISLPRNSKPAYKKYSQVFDIQLNPEKVNRIKTFRGVSLSSFLKDKLGIDPGRNINAKVHIYEAIPGTWLSKISKYEKVPGLNSSTEKSWVQLHPLTVEAASLLLGSPSLGKEINPKFLQSRHKIAIGERFFYLEIKGAMLRIPIISRNQDRLRNGNRPYSNPVQAGQGKDVNQACGCNNTNGANINNSYGNGSYSSGSNTSYSVKPGEGRGDNSQITVIPRSSDYQIVINLIQSQIKFNVFFSEADAITIANDISRKDIINAILNLNKIYVRIKRDIETTVKTKVKMIHESMPELYFENMTEENEGGIKGILIEAIVTKLVDKIIDYIFTAIENYLKARGTDFINAQKDDNYGVTVKLILSDVKGLKLIGNTVRSLRGKLSVPNIGSMNINFPTPSVEILPGYKFD